MPGPVAEQAYQAVRMWGGTGHFNWAPWEQEADYAVPLDLMRVDPAPQAP